MLLVTKRVSIVICLRLVVDLLLTVFVQFTLTVIHNCMSRTLLVICKCDQLTVRPSWYMGVFVWHAYACVIPRVDYATTCTILTLRISGL